MKNFVVLIYGYLKLLCTSLVKLLAIKFIYFYSNICVKYSQNLLTIDLCKKISLSLPLQLFFTIFFFHFQDDERFCLKVW